MCVRCVAPLLARCIHVFSFDSYKLAYSITHLLHQKCSRRKNLEIKADCLPFLLVFTQPLVIVVILLKLMLLFAVPVTNAVIVMNTLPVRILGIPQVVEYNRQQALAGGAEPPSGSDFPSAPDLNSLDSDQKPSTSAAAASSASSSRGLIPSRYDPPPPPSESLKSVYY